MPRAFVTEKQVHTGDYLMADEWFTRACITSNGVYRVERVDELEGVSILCDCGHRHILDTDARGRLTGFYKCEGLQ